MKKLFCALLTLFLALPVLGLAIDLSQPPILVPPDLKEFAAFTGCVYQIDVDTSLYDWETSNFAVANGMPGDGKFLILQCGEATITGTPNDDNKDLKKISVDIQVPEFAYAPPELVIDTPEGGYYQYKFQAPGAWSCDIDHNSDLFEVESVDDPYDDQMNLYHITPIKAGEDEITITINREKIIIPVTITETAVQ